MHHLCNRRIADFEKKECGQIKNRNLIIKIDGDNMLFYSFSSQKERQMIGNSFIELQYCKLPVQTGLENLLSPDNIHSNENDSLYVQIDDDTIFYDEYSHIFDCGIYANMETGIVDLLGINYYSPDTIDSLIIKIGKEKPIESEKIIEWLLKSKKYNGFYILGY